MPDDTNGTPTPQGEGTSVVNGDAQVESLSLDELNKLTGSTYKTVEDAKKGIQNLRSFVGAKEEKVIEKVVNTGEFITKEQYEQDVFYSKHEDLVPYKDIINARAKELKLTPWDAVEKDNSLKDTISKLRVADETEKAKSVLMSSPRLGQVTDSLSVAREAVQKGDFNAASLNAVKAVMDAYGK